MPSSKRSATSRLPWRRLRAAALAALPLLALGLAGASAQNVSFFRIGTGSTAGTYFPIGGLTASAISSPPGSRDCKGGGGRSEKRRGGIEGVSRGRFRWWPDQYKNKKVHRQIVYHSTDHTKST